MSEIKSQEGNHGNLLAQVNEHKPASTYSKRAGKRRRG
jgi:hypothetical protein